MTTVAQMLADLADSGVGSYQVAKRLTESGVRCQWTQVDRAAKGGRVEYAIGKAIEALHAEEVSRGTEKLHA